MENNKEEKGGQVKKDKSITIEKIETKYKLDKGEYCIYACLDADGDITLLNERDKEGFEFCGSDPEVVAAVGELIVAASKIK